MRLPQRNVKSLTRLVLAAVIFTQGILAAHACLEPASAVTQALSDAQTAVPMHCHTTVKVNANECLMHCTQSDQVNLGQHDLASLPASEVVLHVLMPPLQHKVMTPYYMPLVLNTGPPVSIRYCSFLI